MPIYSISEYLKRAQRAVETMNDARTIDAIMIDGRDYAIDDQGNIRIPRICIISGNGIELRSVKRLKLFSEIKEHFNKMITRALYPVLKIKIIGNVIMDIEIDNKGVKIEDVAQKIVDIAKSQKKYAVFQGEGVFYWRGEQAVIENGDERVYLPSRLLSPAALAQILDGKKIKYLLLTVPGSRIADAFIVTGVTEGEVNEPTGLSSTEDTETVEEERTETEEEEQQLRSEFNELISQAIEVESNEG